MVKVSHNNVDVVIRVSVLKVTSTIVLWVYELLQRGEECTVSLSLFADPERILRRFYVFTEEPCKSISTTSEPCSPVFKEVQPRPWEHSKFNISQTNILIIVHNVFYC